MASQPKHVGSAFEKAGLSEAFRASSGSVPLRRGGPVTSFMATPSLPQKPMTETFQSHAQDRNGTKPQRAPAISSREAPRDGHQENRSSPSNVNASAGHVGREQNSPRIVTNPVHRSTQDSIVTVDRVIESPASMNNTIPTSFVAPVIHSAADLAGHIIRMEVLLQGAMAELDHLKRMTGRAA